jgi:phosphatidylinositol glycan class H protein
MVLAVLARLTAPPTQNLRILSPTPSTVSFTVSTRPVPATLAAKLRYYVGLLTRLLLGSTALFALWVKWRVSHGLTTDILLYALGGPQTAALLKGVGGTKWSYIGGGTFVVLFAVLRRGYTRMYLLLTMWLCILTLYRRVSDGAAWPWCTDEFLCGYVPAGAAESVHSYEPYPGCVNPRSVSRV